MGAVIEVASLLVGVANLLLVLLIVLPRVGKLNPRKDVSEVIE